jgi:hypothetical protein
MSPPLLVNSTSLPCFVTPAKAGVHVAARWIPAFAGMTERMADDNTHSEEASA